MAEKKYKKNDLRLKLQENMKQDVSVLEFAKWIRWYCERENQPTTIIRAKKLSAAEVEGLENWLGYSMR